MSTPMTKEREAEIRGICRPEFTGSNQPEHVYIYRELLIEIDRLRANENLAAAAVLEMAAQQMIEHHLTSCNPYTGYYQVRCRCGWSARTELMENDAIKLWADHAIRALIPDA